MNMPPTIPEAYSFRDGEAEPESEKAADYVETKSKLACDFVDRPGRDCVAGDRHLSAALRIGY